MIFLTTTAIDLDEEMLNRCMASRSTKTGEQTKGDPPCQRQAQNGRGLLRRQDRNAILYRSSQRAAALEARSCRQFLRAQG